MQDTIIQLKALGQMPDSLTGNPAGELVSKYDELLIKVKTPLTEEEVEALIGIFPESTMYEVEWTLLHLVETYAVEAEQQQPQVVAVTVAQPELLPA